MKLIIDRELLRWLACETTTIGYVQYDTVARVNRRGVVEHERQCEVSLLVAIDLEPLQVSSANLGVVYGIEELQSWISMGIDIFDATHLGIDTIELDGEVIRVVDTVLSCEIMAWCTVCSDLRDRYLQINCYTVILDLELKSV